MATVSPFFNAGATATVDSLAVLQLKREHQIQIILSKSVEAADGYAEGAVANTRFGSFPHSTLLDRPWGSQILASKVDTGSRARGRKRKRDPKDDSESTRESPTPVQAAVVAGTGFGHLLQPTPESWTVSLPHRTQVVYTPDYSYILQRMCVTPGSHLIEAGAGSGSFTHAAGRAVFNHPNSGHIYSFEYHEPRVHSLQAELDSHRLSQLVTVTHRDVYNEGFLLPNGTSPLATAVFLDLPAPWQALRNLTRRPLSQALHKALATAQGANGTGTPMHDHHISEDPNFTSPLDPSRPVHLCTFIPCIEQVQSVVAALRQLGWVEIQMMAIANHKLEIRRERVGYAEDGLRGATGGPKDVREAVERLREVEGRFRAWEDSVKVGMERKEKKARGESPRVTAKQARQEKNRELQRARKTFREGMLVHRTEPDVKAHTSYLVFAVLPVEWTEEDERKAEQMWAAGEEKVEKAGEAAIETDVAGGHDAERVDKKRAREETGVQHDGSEREEKRLRVDGQSD